jgi:hypothetical protein
MLTCNEGSKDKDNLAFAITIFFPDASMDACYHSAEQTRRSDLKEIDS